MEQTPQKPLTPFDEITSPSSLYFLKLLLPYAPGNQQRTFAILLRFLELKYTIDSFFGFQGKKKTFSAQSFFSDLIPYMNPKEREQMEQFQSMMQMMEMVQGMSGTDGQPMPFSPEAFAGMMNPQDMDLFKSYQSMFEDQLDHVQPDNAKGGASHGRMDEKPGSAESGPTQTGNHADSCEADPWKKRPGAGPDHDGSDHQRQQERDSFHSTGNPSDY